MIYYVYKFRIKRNGAVYIGATSNLERRKAEHFAEIKKLIPHVTKKDNLLRKNKKIPFVPKMMYLKIAITICNNKTRHYCINKLNLDQEISFKILNSFDSLERTSIYERNKIREAKRKGKCLNGILSCDYTLQSHVRTSN